MRLDSTLKQMDCGSHDSTVPSSTSRSSIRMPNHVQKNTKDAYRYHESLKKLKYEKRVVEVEQSSFTPLIFSCTGGASPNTNKVITRIAQKLSHKREESFSDIVSYIRTRLYFALLRSCLLCIRGCKVFKKNRN